MDIDQLTQTVDWLDKERQKDQQKLAVFNERLTTLANENIALQQRIKELESDLTKAMTIAGRVTAVNTMLDQVRADVNKQIETLEARRAEADREQDRLRQVEREALNREVAKLQKTLDAVPRLEQDMAGRKEEERRVSKLLTDLQAKVGDALRRDDERIRAMAALEEGRRQDAKRVTDLQAEVPDLRKKADEHRTKLEILEDLVRRNDVKVGEMLTLENDRRLSQMAWMETQAMTTAERDRAWADLRQRAEAVIRDTENFSRRMETYSETHRQMKKAIEETYVNFERIERRIAEAAEIQRLTEERFRQEWAAFLADEQKRWTTHMLLRDEQWRDHDRQSAKLVERVTVMEDEVPDLRETLRALQALDQARLQSIFNLMREFLAEYDQTLTKVR
jgi:chromosome segregation ATPase